MAEIHGVVVTEVPQVSAHRYCYQTYRDHHHLEVRHLTFQLTNADGYLYFLT